MLKGLIIFAAQYLYLVIMLIAAVHFFLLPKGEKKFFVILEVIALPCIYVASRIVAHFYFDPRPFVVGHFTPLIPHSPDNGFPSDHALLISAVASVMFVYNKKASLVLWVLTLIVGVARVMAGVHHMVDIIGAVTISILLTAIIEYVLKRQRVFLYRH